MCPWVARQPPRGPARRESGRRIEGPAATPSLDQKRPRLEMLCRRPEASPQNPRPLSAVRVPAKGIRRAPGPRRVTAEALRPARCPPLAPRGPRREWGTEAADGRSCARGVTEVGRARALTRHASEQRRLFPKCSKLAQLPPSLVSPPIARQAASTIRSPAHTQNRAPVMRTARSPRTFLDPYARARDPVYWQITPGISLRNLNQSGQIL
jgi:hypothetical protein